MLWHVLTCVIALMILQQINISSCKANHEENKPSHDQAQRDIIFDEVADFDDIVENAPVQDIFDSKSLHVRQATIIKDPDKLIRLKAAVEHTTSPSYSKLTEEVLKLKFGPTTKYEINAKTMRSKIDRKRNKEGNKSVNSKKIPKAIKKKSRIPVERLNAERLDLKAYQLARARESKAHQRSSISDESCNYGKIFKRAPEMRDNIEIRAHHKPNFKTKTYKLNESLKKTNPPIASKKPQTPTKNNQQESQKQKLQSSVGVYNGEEEEGEEVYKDYVEEPIQKFKGETNSVKPTDTPPNQTMEYQSWKTTPHQHPHNYKIITAENNSKKQKQGRVLVLKSEHLEIAEIPKISENVDENLIPKRSKSNNKFQEYFDLQNEIPQQKNVKDNHENEPWGFQSYDRNSLKKMGTESVIQGFHGSFQQNGPKIPSAWKRGNSNIQLSNPISIMKEAPKISNEKRQRSNSVHFKEFLHSPHSNKNQNGEEVETKFGEDLKRASAKQSALKNYNQNLEKMAIKHIIEDFGSGAEKEESSQVEKPLRDQKVYEHSKNNPLGLLLKTPAENNDLENFSNFEKHLGNQKKTNSVHRTNPIKKRLEKVSKKINKPKTEEHKTVKNNEAHEEQKQTPEDDSYRQILAKTKFDDVFGGLMYDSYDKRKIPSRNFYSHPGLIATRNNEKYYDKPARSYPILRKYIFRPIQLDRKRRKIRLRNRLRRSIKTVTTFPQFKVKSPVEEMQESKKYISDVYDFLAKLTEIQNDVHQNAQFQYGSTNGAIITAGPKIQPSKIKENLKEYMDKHRKSKKATEKTLSFDLKHDRLKKSKHKKIKETESQKYLNAAYKLIGQLDELENEIHRKFNIHKPVRKYTIGMILPTTTKPKITSPLVIRRVPTQNENHPTKVILPLSLGRPTIQVEVNPELFKKIEAIKESIQNAMDPISIVKFDDAPRLQLSQITSPVSIMKKGISENPLIFDGTLEYPPIQKHQTLFIPGTNQLSEFPNPKVQQAKLSLETLIRLPSLLKVPSQPTLTEVTTEDALSWENMFITDMNQLQREKDNSKESYEDEDDDDEDFEPKSKRASKNSLEEDYLYDDYLNDIKHDEKAKAHIAKVLDPEEAQFRPRLSPRAVNLKDVVENADHMLQQLGKQVCQHNKKLSLETLSNIKDSLKVIEVLINDVEDPTPYIQQLYTSALSLVTPTPQQLYTAGFSLITPSPFVKFVPTMTRPGRDSATPSTFNLNFTPFRPLRDNPATTPDEGFANTFADNLAESNKLMRYILLKNSLDMLNNILNYVSNMKQVLNNSCSQKSDSDLMNSVQQRSTIRSRHAGGVDEDDEVKAPVHRNQYKQNINFVNLMRSFTFLPEQTSASTTSSHASLHPALFHSTTTTTTTHSTTLEPSKIPTRWANTLRPFSDSENLFERLNLLLESSTSPTPTPTQAPNKEKLLILMRALKEKRFTISHYPQVPHKRKRSISENQISPPSSSSCNNTETTTDSACDNNLETTTESSCLNNLETTTESSCLNNLETTSESSDLNNAETTTESSCLNNTETTSESSCGNDIESTETTTDDLVSWPKSAASDLVKDVDVTTTKKCGTKPLLEFSGTAGNIKHGSAKLALPRPIRDIENLPQVSSRCGTCKNKKPDEKINSSLILFPEINNRLIEDHIFNSEPLSDRFIRALSSKTPPNAKSMSVLRGVLPLEEDKCKTNATNKTKGGNKPPKPKCGSFCEVHKLEKRSDCDNTTTTNTTTTETTTTTTETTTTTCTTSKTTAKATTTKKEDEKSWPEFADVSERSLGFERSVSNKVRCFENTTCESEGENTTDVSCPNSSQSVNPVADFQYIQNKLKRFSENNPEYLDDYDLGLEEGPSTNRMDRLERDLSVAYELQEILNGMKLESEEERVIKRRARSVRSNGDESMLKIIIRGDNGRDLTVSSDQGSDRKQNLIRKFRGKQQPHGLNLILEDYGSDQPFKRQLIPDIEETYGSAENYDDDLINPRINNNKRKRFLMCRKSKQKKRKKKKKKFWKKLFGRKASKPQYKHFLNQKEQNF